MRHFPIFVDLQAARVLVAGAGETASAKLRLLLKTGAHIEVYGRDPCADVIGWAGSGKITLFSRELLACDLPGARLVYAAADDEVADGRVRKMAEAAGVLVNVVDNLEMSQFITPALVDRNPLCIAIGTEGTAPVLARKIKAQIEDMIDVSTGTLARLAGEFRDLAERLPAGRQRRAFWADYFADFGPDALVRGGEEEVRAALKARVDAHERPQPSHGRVILVGAGPGDPELLTLKARRLLRDADVVLYDQLVDPRILEIARREALLIETGKRAGGPAWKQEDINAAMIAHAKAGAVVVRLKSGDPLMFGRADEELDALEEAGIDWEVVPGITAASAAGAALGRSLTRRGRNGSISFITAHDAKGYAEQDWRTLAQPGACFAIYMGVGAARFVQGRLLLHGAHPDTPVTIIENASRPSQRLVSTRLGGMGSDIASTGITGPAIIFVGLSARGSMAHGLQISAARQEAV